MQLYIKYIKLLQFVAHAHTAEQQQYQMYLFKMLSFNRSDFVI